MPDLDLETIEGGGGAGFNQSEITLTTYQNLFQFQPNLVQRYLYLLLFLKKKPEEIEIY